MITCAIVEDDPMHATKLQNLLTQVGEPVKVICPVCRNVDEAYKAIVEHKPELVFLDVELGSGISFELLNKFETIDFDVIFTTNHINKYIYQIRLCYMTYLAKPIDLVELKDALSKFHQRRIDKMSSLQINTLKHNIYTDIIENKIIMVEHDNSLYPIDVSDILYLFSDNNIVTFVLQPQSKQRHKDMFSSKIRTHNITTKNPKHLEIIELPTHKKNLSEWADDLFHLQFCRTHQSYLINMKAVVKLMKQTKEIEKKFVGEGGTVVLVFDIKLPVSKSGREKFMDFRK